MKPPYPALPDGLRVAIVHDWLITRGGAELVLAELLAVFPQASVFTLIDRMNAHERAFLGVGTTSTSILNHVPGIARHYRRWLPLFPAAVRTLDVSRYDLVISNSHAVANAVQTREGQLHLSYCLSPMRYAWDLREQYLKESHLDRGIRGMMARGLLNRMQRWDLAASHDVDAFATLSQYIAHRIRRAYGREAMVVYPPVDVEYFTPSIGQPLQANSYYVTASRFVPYKRVDLLAAAFRQLGDRRLVILGDGPDGAKVRAAAGSNVTVAGRCSREQLREWLRGARAFIFAAEEDFGIAPLEAQACGIPVIAFGKGGALETVRSGADGDSACATGLFFHDQTDEAIADAVRRFERLEPAIRPHDCRVNAERFCPARFRQEIQQWVEAEWERFTSRRMGNRAS